MDVKVLTFINIIKDKLIFSCSNSLVIYDGCPKSIAGNIWWPRAKWGEYVTENCPIGSQGKATRLCHNTLDVWQSPDIFNCTSNSFMDLQRLVSILI